jgi:hypothetical protein
VDLTPHYGTKWRNFGLKSEFYRKFWLKSGKFYQISANFSKNFKNFFKNVQNFEIFLKNSKNLIILTFFLQIFYEIYENICKIYQNFKFFEDFCTFFEEIFKTLALEMSNNTKKH